MENRVLTSLKQVLFEETINRNCHSISKMQSRLAREEKFVFNKLEILPKRAFQPQLTTQSGPPNSFLVEI